jgi:twitching motility protein PilT
VHHINRTQARHVVTLEDPIEYLHRDLTGSISQREIGTDTDDVASGLQAARRQDPDVVVISELRETLAIDRAIRAAESNCLVLAALTAHDAAGCLIQLVTTMLPDEREVGRVRLASAFRGVIAQRLVAKGKAGGRQVVVEWVESTPAVQDAIASGADASGLHKALEKAAKEGHAKLFPVGRYSAAEAP